VQINLWQMHHVMRFRSHGGYLSTLIKTPDRISERPARGGHSFLRRLSCECPLLEQSEQR
jgi:hypothetical protein